MYADDASVDAPNADDSTDAAASATADGSAPGDAADAARPAGGRRREYDGEDDEGSARSISALPGLRPHAGREYTGPIYPAMPCFQIIN